MSCNERQSVAIGRLMFVGSVALFAVMVAASSSELLAKTKRFQPTNETMIHVEVIVKHCRAELYLNDIPQALVDSEGTPNASVPASAFVINGTNTLTVVISPGPTPSQARSSRPGVQSQSGMEAWARIVRYQEGEFTEPGRGETLAELRWSGESKDLLPKILSAAVDLGSQFGPWQWQSSDVLTLDKATWTSAVEVIENIQKCYAKGDTGPIVALAKIKHAETERAFPAYEPGMLEAMFEDQLATYAGHPKWKPGSLSRDSYDLRLVAGGRMIEAIAKDWRPIVRMRGGAFAYRVMLGRIKGKWHILR